MDVRIGVTQAPRELSLELADDTDVVALRSRIEAVLTDESLVLWLTDKKGRSTGIPGKKIAYVELGTPEGERRIGFGG